MSLFRSIFTWWHDQTWGTAWFTFKKGVLVGEDDQGNKYYRERKGPRRWVIYNGDIDASRIAPDWHRWLHYTSQEPPTEKPLIAKPWEREHQPNLTGTSQAYFPPGSLNDLGERSQATGDYQAWKPE